MRAGQRRMGPLQCLGGGDFIRCTMRTELQQCTTSNVPALGSMCSPSDRGFSVIPSLSVIASKGAAAARDGACVRSRIRDSPSAADPKHAHSHHLLYTARDLRGGWSHDRYACPYAKLMHRGRFRASAQYDVGRWIRSGKKALWQEMKRMR